MEGGAGGGDGESNLEKFYLMRLCEMREKNCQLLIRWSAFGRESSHDSIVTERFWGLGVRGEERRGEGVEGGGGHKLRFP